MNQAVTWQDFWFPTGAATMRVQSCMCARCCLPSGPAAQLVFTAYSSQTTLETLKESNDADGDDDDDDDHSDHLQWQRP